MRGARVRCRRCEPGAFRAGRTRDLYVGPERKGNPFVEIALPARTMVGMMPPDEGRGDLRMIRLLCWRCTAAVNCNAPQAYRHVRSGFTESSK